MDLVVTTQTFGVPKSTIRYDLVYNVHLGSAVCSNAVVVSIEVDSGEARPSCH